MASSSLAMFASAPFICRSSPMPPMRPRQELSFILAGGSCLMEVVVSSEAKLVLGLPATIEDKDRLLRRPSATASGTALDVVAFEVGALDGSSAGAPDGSGALDGAGCFLPSMTGLLATVPTVSVCLSSDEDLALTELVEDEDDRTTGASMSAEAD